MAKSTRKSSSAAPMRAPVKKPISQTTGEPESKKPDPGSKQSLVIAMLRSPSGATITTMMAATGWQQHSVRGFLAGVVRKKLKLKLRSTKIDGHRVYRIDHGNGVEQKRSKRRAA
jgi:Protein of unknown function (DUF3489)